MKIKFVFLGFLLFAEGCSKSNSQHSVLNSDGQSMETTGFSDVEARQVWLNGGRVGNVRIEIEETFLPDLGEYAELPPVATITRYFSGVRFRIIDQNKLTISEWGRYEGRPDSVERYYFDILSVHKGFVLLPVGPKT